ncbi:unnamed protein product [Ilex paraguariensis]|uniref:C3H1-type domain-containing protein n=1 Tax=Ilex paraguariensis TaxID=185542 RepID=A0ABC8RGJ0_9AQUA
MEPSEESQHQSMGNYQSQNKNDDKQPKDVIALGFESALPSDPNRDPNLNDEDKLNLIVATEEHQNLSLREEPVNEEPQNFVLENTANEERELKQAINEEDYGKKERENEGYSSVLGENEVNNEKHSDHEEDGENEGQNEEGQGLTCENATDEERESKQAINEEEYGKKERENEGKSSAVAENEVNNEKHPDHKEEAENEGQDEDWSAKNEYDKDEYGIENHEYNWSENEWERDDVNEKEGDGNDDGAMSMPISTSTPISKDDRNNWRNQYPQRPDAGVCPVYMKTGNCKFGSYCKFNHPARRKNPGAKEKVKQKEESPQRPERPGKTECKGAKEKVKQKEESPQRPERPGKTECKYYLTSGGCKYGKACRYNHNGGKTSVAPILEFNFLGLPIRLGEKECPHYMRNGSCKYGSNCRFNHPDPTAVGGGDSPSGYGNDGSFSLQGVSDSTMASWSSHRMNETTPYMPMLFPPTPDPEWSRYQAPVYPISERNLPTPPALVMKNPATDTNFYPHQQQQMLVDEYPERPGQPECSYFLKTGDCKYRSNCKFHHPKSRMPKPPPCILSDKGLPLRPDQNICSHYSRYGICKFGPACRFDHPTNYGNSSSSVESEPNQPPSIANSTMVDGARMAI